MSKNFIIPLVIYPFDVMVSIAQSDDDLKKEILKYKGTEEVKNNFDMCKWNSPTNRGKTVCMGGKQTIIRLRYYPRTPEYKGVLSHEVFHAAHFIMENLEMPLCNKNDEAYAYLIDYITKEIYKKI